MKRILTEEKYFRIYEEGYSDMGLHTPDVIYVDVPYVSDDECARLLAEEKKKHDKYFFPEAIIYWKTVSEEIID